MWLPMYLIAVYRFENMINLSRIIGNTCHRYMNMLLNYSDGHGFTSNAQHQWISYDQLIKVHFLKCYIF